MIIVLEGLDGAGKTSALEYLKKHLAEQGYNVVVGFEPGGTLAANAIRRTVKSTEMCKASQSLLFMAARIENHIDGAIYQYLQKIEANPNTVLILDRYDASTYVYQGLIERPNLAAIYERVADTMNFIEPNVYVFFDVSYEESKRRRLSDSREADIQMNADVLEKSLQSEDDFNKMRNDYRNFFVSKKMSSQVPWVSIDTTELSEDEKLTVLTEKLNAYLIPISECSRQ